MSEREPAVELLALLEALEQQVLAEPTLAADYRAARRGFPAPAGDEHAALRFREWFLLEHVPDALGAPPVLAWSPAEPEAGSAWENLLGARFGILRPLEDGGGAAEELWTGRRMDLGPLAADGVEDLLMVGWFAPLGDDLALPLPGSRALAVPGLLEALRRDLAQARVDNPRGRLSQQACEQMLLGLTGAVAAPAADAPAMPGVDLAAGLEALLADESAWDAARALAKLARDGDTALLDALAFDTDVDLEAARRLLLEARERELAEADAEPAGDAASREAAHGAHARAHAHAADCADADTVAAAIAAFDASAGEASVAERFAELERALGLEPGSTDEGTPLADEEAEALGPGSLPGLPFWIASWAWEVEQLGQPAREGELRTLAAFQDFVDASREDALDAHEITRADLTGFLLASHGAGVLEERRAGIARFSDWLAEEQQAPVDGLSEELRGPLGERLQAAVSANAELAAQQTAADAAARLVDAAPPAVESEEGEKVAVQGLPEAALAHCRAGDRVLGHWRAGEFHAAAWMPQELLPSGGA